MTSQMHIEKEGVSHFGLVFWWKDGDKRCRWEGKKERNDEILFQNCVYTQYVTLFLAFVRLLIYCVYTQILKTILTFLSFLYLLTCPMRLHPFTKIPVQNDQPSIFLNCTHDVIQVEQICTTCRQKRYTCILLEHQ